MSLTYVRRKCMLKQGPCHQSFLSDQLLVHRGIVVAPLVGETKEWEDMRGAEGILSPLD